MSNNENTATIETLKNILTFVGEGITKLEADLSACVLDGTPFALLSDHISDGSDRVLTMIYGSYVGRPANCFVCLEVVPNHFCGTSLWDREAARKNVAALKAQGYINPRYVHIRDLKTARLAQLKKTHADVSATLASYAA